MRTGMLLASMLTLCRLAPVTAQGQSPPVRLHSELAVTAGLGTLVATPFQEPGQVLSRESHVAVGATIRVTVLGNARGGLMVSGTYVRDEAGRELGAATAGLQILAGRTGAIPIHLGFGLVRQPTDDYCTDDCLPPPATRTSPALTLGIGYLLTIGRRVAIGPELGYIRALNGGPQPHYHAVLLGIRLARRI